MEKKLLNLKEGDAIFVKYNPWGNNDRYKAVLKEGQVTKIGRKYIYIQIGYNEETFDVNLPLPYIATNGEYSLYSSEEQYRDCEEHKKNFASLKQFIAKSSYKDLSADQVKQINQILGI